jgi:hypothetical protein
MGVGALEQLEGGDALVRSGAYREPASMSPNAISRAPRTATP